MTKDVLKAGAEMKLLIADDDEHFGETLELEFTDRGYAVTRVRSAAVLASLPARYFDLALVDLRLGTDNGLDMVATLITENPDCRIVMLTGYGSIATAIKAIKLGAHNYLTKPASIDVIENALRDEESSVATNEPENQAPSLAKHEREYIESVLNDCGGNISRAARVLGLHRQSLQRKLRKFSPL
jgi:two-component system, response regulator RegA